MADVFTKAPSHGLYRSVNPIDFYASAYIGTVMSAVGLISLPAHIAGYLAAGVLRRFRASSISQWYMLGSQIIISMVIIIVSSALLITSTVLAYELKIPESFGAVVVAVLLGALTFTVLEVFLGTVLPTPRAAHIGLTTFLFYDATTVRRRSAAGTPR